MIVRIIFLLILMFTTTVNAEIKTYEGVNEYVMSDFENQEVAKLRAKVKAEQAAQQKAYSYVKKYLTNYKLTDNEI